MAKTMRKEGLLVNPLNDPLFGLVTFHQPEGATQTFTQGAPLIWSSGFLVEATSPLNPAAELVAAFALEAGHNSAAAGDDMLEVAMAGLGINLILEANFMANAGADNVLAAADLGSSTAGLESHADFPDTGDGGWYFEDGGTAAVKIIEFDSSQVASDINDYKPAAGDTNARVRGHLLETAIDW